MSDHPSNAGKWDAPYAGVTERRPYGDSVTYAKAAEFLDGLAVEDWGCGLGWFKHFARGPYTGVDGSHSKFADKIVDLCTYRSTTEGLLLRHVLEHNHDWRPILQNALASFTRRMVLVIFTPLVDATRVLSEPDYDWGVKIPDIAFARADLVREMDAVGGVSYREETLRTATEYSEETVFYLTKSGGTPH